MTFNFLAFLCLCYVGLLFFVAFTSDQLAINGKARWLRHPLFYTLSLSVYCTAWTFYGAVGSAARSGLEFLAIYIGPTIVFMGWWLILRKMVTIGRAQNITSIADFISTRFGKSNSVAVLVTVICLCAITPYISLQLRSITDSFHVIGQLSDDDRGFSSIALLSTFGLALFVILYGTRNPTISERHAGIVTAIALESIVKLIAIILVGVFAVSSIGSLSEVFALPEAQELLSKPLFSSRWFGLVSMSFMAVLVLPRMFHVLVVESDGEEHLLLASWAFPLYLLLLNFFVLPIAIVGLNMFGDSQNPDYFLITIPKSLGQDWLALVAFIGGFSAATSMVVMSSISVSIMITNHIIAPFWLALHDEQKDLINVRHWLLYSRRITIAFIMLLGYIYYETQIGMSSLASTGFIAFAGVAQLFPSLFAALFWKGATKIGALMAMGSGSLIWLYTYYLPSIAPASIIIDQSQGLDFLMPDGLLLTKFDDPLLRSLALSLGINVGMLIIVSLITTPSALENLFANRYVSALSQRATVSFLRRQEELHIEDIHFLAQYILGEDETATFFSDQARFQGRDRDLPIITDRFLERLETKFSGVVGGAMAHALISQLAGTRAVPMAETVKLADETMQNLQYARAIKLQSEELERTAQALREANIALLEMDSQKDNFLSQVSHELRTPLTSLRSMTEILHSTNDLTLADRKRILTTMMQEYERLTGLLDEILDLSYLSNGREHLIVEKHDISTILAHSIHVTEGIWKTFGLDLVSRQPTKTIYVEVDFNRISQVFINLINNAAKYVISDQPKLTISISSTTKFVRIDFSDNGVGVPAERRKQIFDKFIRGTTSEVAGSAGLGLAISREIIERHGGTIKLLDTLNGAKFRIQLPKKQFQSK